MTAKKELQRAYALAIVLLVVGILSYAAFPAKTPEQPPRIMLKNVAGKVLFDHKTHTSVRGYGLSCLDCHHTDAEDETEPELCSEGGCHEPKSEDEDMLNRFDAFHLQCIGCHQEFEVSPLEEQCELCHVM